MQCQMQTCCGAMLDALQRARTARDTPRDNSQLAALEELLHSLCARVEELQQRRCPHCAGGEPGARKAAVRSPSGSGGLQFQPPGATVESSADAPPRGGWSKNPPRFSTPRDYRDRDVVSRPAWPIRGNNR
eukprot:196217-Chlamydomonas_euryale.AAC.4